VTRIHTGILAATCGMLLAAPVVAQQADTQKELAAIKAAIPKFAIPMREVGDRFQNMSVAAHGGNWALAAYMSKYMNGAMNPAALTKPEEYKVWKGFYENTFADVNKAIMAKDIKAFDSAYNAVIGDCNGCHKAMGYGFIEVVKQKAASDVGVKYTLKSEPDAVPK
jgi:hypothetical protein